MNQVAENTLRGGSGAEVVADIGLGRAGTDHSIDMTPSGTLSAHVRDRLREIEHRYAVTLAGLAQREGEVTALRQRIEYMRGEERNALCQMQQALQDARRSHTRSEKTVAVLGRDLDEAHAELRAAQSHAQELEQHVATLLASLDATRADIERAAASRAWRYGHRLTRTASRLMLRKHRTDGALLTALARLDEVQRHLLAAPAESCRPGQTVQD